MFNYNRLTTIFILGYILSVSGCIFDESPQSARIQMENQYTLENLKYADFTDEDFLGLASIENERERFAQFVVYIETKKRQMEKPVQSDCNCQQPK